MSHDVYGLPERLGRLLRSHAPEVPHFDEPRKRLIFVRKGLQSAIQVQNLGLFRTGVGSNFQVM